MCIHMYINISILLIFLNIVGDAYWKLYIAIYLDFNGDGTVNVSDLNTLLSNYNKHVDVSSGIGASVPEPSTLGLLAMAGVAGAGVAGYNYRKRK